MMNNETSPTILNLLECYKNIQTISGVRHECYGPKIPWKLKSLIFYRGVSNCPECCCLKDLIFLDLLKLWFYEDSEAIKVHQIAHGCLQNVFSIKSFK